MTATAETATPRAAITETPDADPAAFLERQVAAARAALAAYAAVFGIESDDLADPDVFMARLLGLKSALAFAADRLRPFEVLTPAGVVVEDLRSEAQQDIGSCCECCGMDVDWWHMEVVHGAALAENAQRGR